MGRHAHTRHRTHRKPSDPRYCDRDPGCSELVVVAILAPTPPGQERRWAAFEARDRTPFADEAVGSRVIVAGRQAWRPADLIEDYMVRHELTEDAARELVSGFPWHRRHIHESSTTEQHTPTEETTAP